MAKEGKERRILNRVEARLPISVVLLDGRRKPVGTEMSGVLHDLSPGGCAFHVENQLLVGKTVQVRIQLNEELSKKYSRPELQAHGPIVRAAKEGDGYLITMRFLIDR